MVANSDDFEGYGALFEREINELFPNWDEEPPQLLYHYTDANGFLGILESQELWLTHFKHLNDRTELSVGEALVCALVEKIAMEYPSESFQHHLLSCAFAEVYGFVQSQFWNIRRFFSTVPDDLSQWRAYGSNGLGYALGFSFETERTETYLRIVQCVYDRKRIVSEVENLLRKAADGFDTYMQRVTRSREMALDLANRAAILLSSKLYDRAVRLKDAAFEQEHEWRILAMIPADRQSEFVHFRPAKRGVLPYMPYSIGTPNVKSAMVEVIVGPSHDAENQKAAVEMAIRRYKVPHCTVTNSVVPYRGY